MYNIPALQADFRSKFNLWIYLMLIFSIIMLIGGILIASECPLKALKDQSSGERARSVIGSLMISLSQAIQDMGIVYIASYSLRSFLP